MKKKSEKENIVWAIVAAGSAMLAGAVVQRALNSGWRAVTHEDPPRVKELPIEPWRKAIGFTLASAVTAGLATLLSQRGAAAGWEKVTGEPPIKRLKR
ncbi:MAG TPA: DUF4235 domain-containing protein [Gemmatimonadaceae bacterium]|nr:DUF4235 domain-containing protein [Gemmatimonadaceae bacterium]